MKVIWWTRLPSESTNSLKYKTNYVCMSRSMYFSWILSNHLSFTLISTTSHFLLLSLSRLFLPYLLFYLYHQNAISRRSNPVNKQTARGYDLTTCHLYSRRLETLVQGKVLVPVQYILAWTFRSCWTTGVYICYWIILKRTQNVLEWVWTRETICGNQHNMGL